MTSPSRRKRPTTARGPITPARTPASLLAGLLLLAAGPAHAQDPALSSYHPRAVLSGGGASPPPARPAPAATAAPLPLSWQAPPPAPVARSVVPVRYQARPGLTTEES